MNATDRMLAWAQIGLSVLFILGTFLIIGSYELGYAKFSTDQAKDFTGTMQWLTQACMLVMFFWFQRARQGGIPSDPPANVVTQTHTLPDGTKTTITSPATASPTNVPILATSSSSSSQAEHSTTKTDVIPPAPGATHVPETTTTTSSATANPAG